MKKRSRADGFDKKSTLKNLAKEIFSPGYRDRALERKRATRTWWDAITIPLLFAMMGLSWFGFYRLFYWLHVFLYPDDRLRMQELMGGSITIATFLMFVVPIFATFPIGGFIANCLMWLIPPARRAMAEKAKGVKGASFREAQTAMLRIALVLVPIALVSGTVGAVMLGR